MGVRGIMGRLFLRAAYPLYFKRTLSRTNITTLFGFHLTIPPTVFHPGLFFSTSILGRYIQQLSLSGSKVLEMGSGSGVISLIAARCGATVVSVDINPVAVGCTRVNAERNNLSDRVTALESNLFQSIAGDSRFDYIIWNPPFFPDEATNDGEMAWKAGRDYRVLSEFARTAVPFLSRHGKIVTILSSQCALEKILSIFTQYGFQAVLVRKQHSFFESFLIHEMTHHHIHT
jgi:release factor glutamine methyltransferase